MFASRQVALAFFLVALLRVPPINSLVEVGDTADTAVCICDLTVGVCDASCCCDGDCSATAISAFESTTGCLPSGPKPYSVPLCAEERTVYNFRSQLWVDSQLCVVVNNNQALGTFYVADDTTYVTDGAFEDAFSQGGASFADVLQSETEVGDLTSYYPGSQVYVYDAGLSRTSLFSLPAPSATGECSSLTIPTFMNNDAATCNYVFESGTSNGNTTAEECERLSASVFTSFLFLNAPSGLNLFLPSTVGVTVESVECLWSDDGEVGPCNDPDVDDLVLPPAAVDVNGTCTRAVQAVHFVVSYSETLVVSSVTASFVLTNVSMPATSQSSGSSGGTSFSLKRSFSVTFLPATASADSPRALSGNPGYLIGLPVLAATLVDGVLTLPEESGQPMLGYNGGSTSGGHCIETADLSPVLFGYNVLAGCSVDLGLADFVDCGALQLRVVSLLSLMNVTHVGMWGSSDPTVIEDWVPVVSSSASLGVSTGSNNGECTNIPRQLNYEFLYTLQGSVDNPQKKIVGARIGLGEVSTLSLSCSGTMCTPGSTETEAIPLSTAITFTLAPSADPRTVFPPVPSLLPPLNPDVFYPFQTRNGAALLRPSSVSVAAALVTMAVAVLLL